MQTSQPEYKSEHWGQQEPGPRCWFSCRVHQFERAVQCLPERERKILFTQETQRSQWRGRRGSWHCRSHQGIVIARERERSILSRPGRDQRKDNQDLVVWVLSGLYLLAEQSFGYASDGGGVREAVEIEQQDDLDLVQALPTKPSIWGRGTQCLLTLKQGKPVGVNNLHCWQWDSWAISEHTGIQMGDWKYGRNPFRQQRLLLLF